jgi:hypothetical protein
MTLFGHTEDCLSGLLLFWFACGVSAWRHNTPSQGSTMSSSTGGGRSRGLILAAMIFAVAMTFIDQTIVSIAAPTKRPVVLGSALAAAGFALWAGRVTELHAGAQVIYIVMAGAGMGLMLGQANTDAINRASRYSYGEATGITQTVRNYGASLGFTILGTLLITRFRTAITASLAARGLPRRRRTRRRGQRMVERQFLARTHPDAGLCG